MSAGPSPLVSVLTPFYNTAPYLAECIESVLAQTRGDFEYLLVDNCSTDGSDDIAAGYAARDPRIQERMTDAARVFWAMCVPIAAAAGSPDPERDGRGMAAMVDGLLLDRLAHPGQTHELLVEAVARITAPRFVPPEADGAAAGAPRAEAPTARG